MQRYDYPIGLLQHVQAPNNRISGPGKFPTSKQIRQHRRRRSTIYTGHCRISPSEPWCCWSDLLESQQALPAICKVLPPLSTSFPSDQVMNSPNQRANRSRLLSLLHGLDYLTPSIAALAARKVFRHRIIVARPEDDRSLQYGSDIKTVSMILGDVTPDSILDNVLELEGPL
jgi:hypothetical protein